MSHTDSSEPQSKSKRVLVIGVVVGIICIAIILSYIFNIFGTEQTVETESPASVDVEVASEPEAEVEFEIAEQSEPIEIDTESEVAESPETTEVDAESEVVKLPETTEVDAESEVVEITETTEAEIESAVAEITEITEDRNAESEVAKSSETSEEDVELLGIIDIVRVEPDGSTLIAGRSGSNTSITITSDGEILAETVANDTGDFVVVLDDPLEPGSHELKIISTGGYKFETIVVFVPDRGSNDEPLVVVSPADDATEILQLSEPDVGAVEVEQESESARFDVTAEDNEDQEVTIDYELSIRAVESEERKVYVAGEGTKGMLVNVYIENQLIGDVKPDSNERWLLEADMELLPGTYTVRADLINEQDSQVVETCIS